MLVTWMRARSPGKPPKVIENMSKKTMPATVQKVYEALWDDVSTAHFRYPLFLELFGTQEEVDLFNCFAPALFEQDFGVMLDHVRLRLAHLAEPSTQPSSPSTWMGCPVVSWWAPWRSSAADPWKWATAKLRGSRSTRQMASTPGSWSDPSGLQIFRFRRNTPSPSSSTPSDQTGGIISRQLR